MCREWSATGAWCWERATNIAHFSLGRQDAPSKPGGMLEASAVVETDSEVPDAVLKQLLENKAIKVARVVEFKK